MIIDRLKLLGRGLGFILLFFQAVAFAQPDGICRVAYGDVSVGAFGTFKEEAEVFKMFSRRSIETKFPTAMKYITARKYPSREALLVDLSLLCRVIQQTSGGAWIYRKLEGLDGSTIFVGLIGTVLVVSPSGDIYKGKVTFDLYTGGEWNPDYSQLSFIAHGVE